MGFQQKRWIIQYRNETTLCKEALKVLKNEIYVPCLLVHLQFIVRFLQMH
jgi:hypothetical protein